MNREEFINMVSVEQKALRCFLLALCCGNKQDADDIAQDTLVKAYLSIDYYQDRGKFRSWIFKIAHNTFLNHKASYKNTTHLDEADKLMASNDADSGYEYQALYIALGTLSPKIRSAIVMFYINGYSIKEIAAITDTSEDAVKKQLSRGRDELKNRLKL